MSTRDDKGRVVTFRKASDWDGQSYEPLFREHCRPSTALRSGFGNNHEGAPEDIDDGAFHCSNFTDFLSRMNSHHRIG